MDSAEQAAGERRVRELLIEPLARRGLARPSSLTRAQYEEMCRDLCARLAYMDSLSLEALEEQVAANPAGKDLDRLPIANRILDWAGQIQPPRDDSVSPLMRRAFSHRMGAAAIEQGWGPELLDYLRRKRLWPGEFMVGELRKAGHDNARQMVLIEERLAAGRVVPPEQLRWRDERAAAAARCRRIAELVQAGGAA
ncbi:hypothetical protein EOW65_16650 [Sinirhodobacter ferrireducens]|uniref:Uncharacterized protein n=1 Tax=Paenirhodobacter ferrireducens TaxID=1215032 RepID=A0A443L7K4_9RHOB|nr:hypothetical protein [Sinirhodobacter ferrireducens]RWR45207.1 hypothetical protein EOW65_16650 [Sinirhodobacter ferrireducens]